MFHFNSWCGFCLRVRGEGLFSAGLGSRGRVGLKNGHFRSGFCLRMCGEWFFRVGLGSCGRGIEKTATSGLRVFPRASGKSALIREKREAGSGALPGLSGVLGALLPVSSVVVDVPLYANLASCSLIGPFGSPGRNAAL